MPEKNPGLEFLKQKYDLHNSEEIESAKERTEFKTGERIAQNPDALIQNYLDRFKEITGRTDPEKRQRGIEALKKVLHDKFVTKYEEIPESYWISQEKILRERGQGGDWANASEDQKEEVKRQTAEALLADQESSLEQWIDYLTSEDSNYMPDYIKYWVFRNVIGLVEYDKDKKDFPKRSHGTVKQFPDINHEALSYVVDAVLKKQTGESQSFEYDIQEEEKEKFAKYLANENFAKLYGWAMELINPIPEHLLPVTEGKWVKYDKGSDHLPLVQSIRGRGTGWCTAGENTAKKQLKAGDFYVFYSNDEEGNPTMPRIAIRMEDDKIAEVRGIAYKQNLDPFMGDVLAEKLEEFPDKNQYLKKESDMKKLTEIEQKSKAGEELSKDELIFLYEIDSPIEGFGYQRDPRIEEIKATRDPKIDAPIVLDCQPEEIAWDRDEINDQTKNYIGPLFIGVFQLPNIENIYTSFPEGMIRQVDREIGGISKEQFDQEIMQELKNRGVNISSGAQFMENSSAFTVQKDREIITLVRLKVRDLGFPNGATTEEIYNKAREFGLELCPPEVGPRQRLADMEQPLNQWYSIAMKPIAGRDGSPCVFVLGYGGGGLWLYIGWAAPTGRGGSRRCLRVSPSQDFLSSKTLKQLLFASKIRFSSLED